MFCSLAHKFNRKFYENDSKHKEARKMDYAHVCVCVIHFPSFKVSLIIKIK